MTAIHQLSAADFDLLASGRGDAETIAALRAGQLSKHLLMLRAIDHVASEAVPSLVNTAGFRTAYELMTEIQLAAPAVIRDVLLHPHVGGWLCRCLQQLHDPAPPDYRLRLDLAYAANVAAAAAIRAGLPFRIAVHVRGGRVALPTLGAAAAHGTDTVVVSDGACARVQSAGLAVVVHPDGEADHGWTPVRRLSATAGCRTISVDLDDVDPFRGHNYSAVTGRLTEREAGRWAELFGEAWALLSEDHPTYAVAIAAGLRSLVPQRASGPHRSISATSTDAFGSIALSLPGDAPDFANTLVHEFQHAKLSALLDLVELTDPDPSTRYYAPWRDDPRPLPGLLQGTYAFLGVTDFWRVHRHRATTRGRNALPDFEFARWRTQTENACAELLGSDGLTPAGVHFVSGMGATLAGWHDEQIPAGLEVQARETAIEHGARWRLRNLTPASADVVALAAAWVAGDAPSPLPESGLLSGTSEAHTDAPRLQLWHLRMTAPDEFERLVAQPGSVAARVPGATPADLSFVRGDLGLAVSGYREQIEESSGASAWIGLALALRRSGDEQTAAQLLCRPELLVAVHEHLRSSGSAPSPESVARWLQDTSDRKTVLT